ncbi:unnamed protein product, partial [Oppiella nova]
MEDKTSKKKHKSPQTLGEIQRQQDFFLKPSSAEPSLNAEQWPLLLKNY